MGISVMVDARTLVPVALLMALPVFAIPSFKSHTHSESTVAWEIDGIKDGNSAHNHRSAHGFGGNGLLTEPYSAAACWDNKSYRIDATGFFEKGHCFVDEGVSASIPRYAFVGAGWPSSAKDRVREAFAEWSGVSSDFFMRPLGIQFEETASTAQAEIQVAWIDLGGSVGGGMWDSSARQLRFDSTMNWYFDADPGSIQSDQWHFLSVALHEVGHVVGLDHNADSEDVMTPSVGQPPNASGHRYFVELSGDPVQGVLDLYSQSHSPPPPPQAAECGTTFLGCPYGCQESPYMMSWSAANATDYELQHLTYGLWTTFSFGPGTSDLYSTGTQYSEFFRVRGVNESGAGSWCNMYLQVQCSDYYDPY
jgi:hypothetical protein